MFKLVVDESNTVIYVAGRGLETFQKNYIPIKHIL